jgi:hypothetical protein
LDARHTAGTSGTSGGDRVTRWLTAAMLLVAAGTHISMVPDHLEEAPHVGWGLIVLSALCIVLAVWIVVADGVAVWLFSAGVCLAAVVAFLTSRTIGLPQIRDDVGNWSEPLGFPALLSETLAVLLAGLRLRKRSSLSSTASSTSGNGRTLRG